jgi:hypothetical protein
LQQEHHEAERLLDQQRALIVDLEVLGENSSSCDDEAPQPVQAGMALRGLVPSAAAPSPLELPEPLMNHYRDLLRAYVIMGAGNLGEEMTKLARLLANSGISAQRTMQLHVQVLEELVRGLGNRSARHVMNRADLLVLEVMGHLADSYRQRYHQRQRPPRQLRLPGFEDPRVGLGDPQDASRDDWEKTSSQPPEAVEHPKRSVA